MVCSEIRFAKGLAGRLQVNPSDSERSLNATVTRYHVRAISAVLLLGNHRLFDPWNHLLAVVASVGKE